MCCVIKAMSIHYIDGWCHIKQQKSEKSHKICLTNHTRSISRHITPLVINALRDTNTHRHTDVRGQKILGARQLHDLITIPEIIHIFFYWGIHKFDALFSTVYILRTYK